MAIVSSAHSAVTSIQSSGKIRRGLSCRICGARRLALARMILITVSISSGFMVSGIPRAVARHQFVDSVLIENGAAHKRLCNPLDRWPVFGDQGGGLLLKPLPQRRRGILLLRTE
jgi:hypothetical protein